MFAQHTLAVLRANGMLATVMPHGVLFRGGAEKEIRKGLIEDDVLEAVIGLPPNLFYGAGIPACILVMRSRGAKPAERRGKVLFINADAEYFAGRAQNYRRPEHVEKIASAFAAFRDIPGYAAVVPVAELAANDWNLNIRRYADNAPPPEPQDVRAHLLGGVPKAEVAAKQDLLAAHGLNPLDLLVERDAAYFDFAPPIAERRQISAAIAANAGVEAQEARLRDAFATWWQAREGRLLGLPVTKDLSAVRAELLESFAAALTPIGLLDRFKVSGVIAIWWNESQYDLKTLVEQGFAGLVDGWVSTVLTALENTDSGNGERFDPTSHKVVARLLPGYLEELAASEATRSDLESRLDATTKKGGEEDDTEDVEENEETLSAEEVKALKRDLAAAKKEGQRLKSELARRLEQARAELDEGDCQRLVLDIGRSDLSGHLDRHVVARRVQVVAAFENWWDKYRVTLRDIEAEREGTVTSVNRILGGLGYAN